MEKNKKTAAGSINEQSIWKYIWEKRTAEPSDLSKTAIIDCSREYTYGQMFGEWERYARVFSALGMTEENASRVGIAGTISAEPLFAFYGLNMTGATASMLSYPDFLPSGQWRTMAEKEKLTDLVLSDILITPELWPEIEKAKEELGIRNIILLHSRLGGPCTGPAELVYNEFNHRMLKRLDGTVFMEDLLEKYRSEPIAFGSGDPDHLAVITHTSGTTRGTRKPLPYPERSVNTVATNFGEGFHSIINKQLRIAPSFDFSSFMCMCGLINAYLAGGDTVVLTFFGFLHPKFIRAVERYRLDILFTSGFMIDSWMKRTDIGPEAFSSVKVFSCGGSYIPPDKLRKYTEFAHAHGYKGNILRGYGMSETGGAEIRVPAGCMDDILGFPVPEDSFLVLDENDGKFYKASDGVRTGVMYAASDSLCLNELDGEVLFEFTKINGRNFICTNDMVRVNSDGSFSYAGRADRYFVNNDGVSFNAGIVDNEMSKQPGIDQCAVVPVLDKRIHDTVPALYIVPEKKGKTAVETVCRALGNVFIEGGLLRDNCLPSQFILVDEIPCNSNGKIDIFKITRDRLKGEAYNIIPVSEGGEVTGVEAEPASRLDSITGGTLPEGMGESSALGIFDLFNTTPETRWPSGFREMIRRGSSAHSEWSRTLMNNWESKERMTMFDYFNNQQNPFMFMMNMMANQDTADEAPAGMFLMPFMQQAFMMQMQFMQNMFMMPMHFMQGMAGMMNPNAFMAEPSESGASPQGSFKLGNMNIPPEVLKGLMQMDMSPENLEKLQKVLDFVFEMIPDSKDA